MTIKKVELTEHDSHFVDQLVLSGKYKNESEVVRAGLRLLEQTSAIDEQKLLILHRLAQQGFDELDQGKGIEFSSETSLKDHIAALGRRVGQND